jgi:rhodanese-related sulfurtransferase
MFKQIKLLPFFVVALFLTFSASHAVAAKQYLDIDAAGVKEMMQQEGTLVVFPLSPIEFDNLHIKGSVNIPMDLLASKLPKDKSRAMIFYCLGIKCVASWRAAEKAIELGYENVYAFREGLPAWVDAGYPTVTISKLPDLPLESISTAELAASLGDANFTLVDINLKDDAKKFWINHPQRVHIPLNELHLQLDKLDKTHRIAVICLKGKRSLTAVLYLKSKGFDDVVIVDGGIQKWVLEGRPVKQGS